MNRIKQESLAGRYKSFDTELPLDVRAELAQPRRPRILGRQKTTTLNAGAKWPLYLVLLGCALVIGGSIATWRHGETAERARNKAISQSLTPQPTPTPTALHESSALSSRTPEVRRAERVPVTVKRATLLRLPGQELGVYKWYELPDVWGGGSVWARYMGTKGRFSEIPPDPVPGDLWNVTETGASWVYCMPAGYDHPVWIDP